MLMSTATDTIITAIMSYQTSYLTSKRRSLTNRTRRSLTIDRFRLLRCLYRAFFFLLLLHFPRKLLQRPLVSATRYGYCYGYVSRIILKSIFKSRAIYIYDRHAVCAFNTVKVAIAKTIVCLQQKQSICRN